MNLFGMPTYNNKYMSPNSAKPIAGVCTLSAFTRPLKQVKVMDAYIIPGRPAVINIKEDSSTNVTANAGMNLSPNVMFATSSVTTAFNGWVLSAPTDVLDEGDEYPAARQNQITYAALTGSGAEFYLPCNDNVRTFDPANLSNVIKWDTANNELIYEATGSVANHILVEGITLLSQVVFGVVPYYDTTTNAVKVKEVNVIKVKV